MNPVISLKIEVNRKENGSPVLTSNIHTDECTTYQDLAMAITELEKQKLDLLKLCKPDMEVKE